MNTKPIRENNAIDEIAFIVILSKDIDKESLARLRSAHSAVSDELPHIEDLTSIRLAFGNKTPKDIRPEVSGVQFSKPSSQRERLEWSLRAEGKSIVVGCSEYTNWQEIWGKAKSYLSLALQTIDLNNNPLSEIVYQCVDKFHTDQDKGEYEIGSVFDTNSKYLTNKIVTDSASSWHINQGWFSQTVEGGIEALNNLNLSVVDKIGEAHETTISHIIKAKSVVDLQPLSLESILVDETGYLDRAMIAFHEGNKTVISNLLNQNMKTAIGL